MKKVKFTAPFTHGNGKTDKKGSTKLVTDRHAAWLKANKVADIIEGKEDKEAAGRETK